MRSISSCRCSSIFALLILLTAWAPTALAVNVTLNTGGFTSDVTARARGNTTDTDVQSVQPVSIPDGTVIAAISPDGVASNTTTLNLSNNALSISVEQVRGNVFNSFTSTTGSIFFSVDQAVNYDLSGVYSAIEPLGRTIELQGALINRTTGTTLFSNVQASRTTPNESFVLGQLGGDFNNSLMGSLTGALNPGDTYELTYFANIRANFTASTASASGDITLAFVPEPSSALLMGLGLAGLGGIRRRSTGR